MVHLSAWCTLLNDQIGVHRIISVYVIFQFSQLGLSLSSFFFFEFLMQVPDQMFAMFSCGTSTEHNCLQHMFNHVARTQLMVGYDMPGLPTYLLQFWVWLLPGSLDEYGMWTAKNLILCGIHGDTCLLTASYFVYVSKWSISLTLDYDKYEDEYGFPANVSWVVIKSKKRDEFKSAADYLQCGARWLNQIRLWPYKYIWCYKHSP